LPAQEKPPAKPVDHYFIHAGLEDFNDLNDHRKRGVELPQKQNQNKYEGTMVIKSYRVKMAY